MQIRCVACKAYLEVLKPRESLLLTFIGVVTAVLAAGGFPPLGRLLLVLVAILLASAGANGLTNYLDRGIDARMERTKHRALPSGRIKPPERVLPLVIGLIAIGLGVAWYLHPFVFLVDLIGSIVAATWRKKVTCVFPQGAIASCAPVLMGWFSVKPSFNWEIGLLCLLILLWLPLHVWSIMVSNRQDYRAAGITYFPMCWEAKKSVRVFPAFGVALYAASIAIFFVGGFSWLYLAAANLLGVIMLYASLRLVFSAASRDAWRLYKLSAFPYLGLLFLAMLVDVWLL